MKTIKEYKKVEYSIEEITKALEIEGVVTSIDDVWNDEDDVESVIFTVLGSKGKK